MPLLEAGRAWVQRLSDRDNRNAFLLGFRLERIRVWSGILLIIDENLDQFLRHLLIEGGFVLRRRFGPLRDGFHKVWRA